jgi:hypothetical protein
MPEKIRTIAQATFAVAGRRAGGTPEVDLRRVKANFDREGITAMTPSAATARIERAREAGYRERAWSSAS